MSRPKKEGNLLNIKCAWCGIDIYRYKSQIDNRSSNCCSIKCKEEYKKSARNKNKK